MKHFYPIIKGDYLQRTRSYSFLITIALSVYFAYFFIPPPGAGYTTVSIGNYVGNSNAAWIGHVTAVMTSLFLSLIGFFLINNSIKKDIETEVGMIIAATSVSNFGYLLSKTLSNFLVLLSIMGIVFLMSIGLFFFRGQNYSFDLMSFVLPYLIVTVPSLFFVSSLAIVAEVFVGRRSTIQYILFFALFNFIIANVSSAPETNMVQWRDPFGLKAATMDMHDFVKTHHDPSAGKAVMGFVFSDRKVTIPFTYENVQWSAPFVVSRFIWIAISLALVYIASIFFHRFDLKDVARTKSKKEKNEPAIVPAPAQSIRLSQLPALIAAYGIGPFIKTELLLLYRKGSRWFWIVNAGGMAGLLFAPIIIAHQFILPALWFLQVTRISDLSAKEKMNGLHYFTYASFQPLKRLLSSQIIAGVIMILLLAAPLIIRLLINGEIFSFLSIIAGAIFIVSAAVSFGIMTGGKKLFEIFFFLLAYCNVNRIPFTDYFGGIEASPAQLIVTSLASAGLLIIGYAFRGYEMRSA
jgi:hypothetical protein